MLKDWCSHLGYGGYLITKNVFFVELISRDAIIFTNLILECAKEVATIYTDKWKRYANLARVEYIHQNVNHETDSS